MRKLFCFQILTSPKKAAQLTINTFFKQRVIDRMCFLDAVQPDSHKKV